MVAGAKGRSADHCQRAMAGEPEALPRVSSSRREATKSLAATNVVDKTEHDVICPEASTDIVPSGGIETPDTRIFRAVWRAERDIIATPPTDRISSPHPEVKRDRVLSDKELRYLLNALLDERVHRAAVSQCLRL